MNRIIYNSRYFYASNEAYNTSEYGYNGWCAKIPGDLDIAKDKDVSISPDVLEKVIVSVTEQTYAETDTDTDEDGEASEA